MDQNRFGYPVIPETIVVHLGRPDEPAENVEVSFIDYIKNVASSEIYPTWPESAIRANIYAQISYALNRIYTEYYRSRGYDFDITNSTQYDQYFVKDREIFENISRIVDDIFNSYVVRQGSIVPMFTQYCDGLNVKCEGLSQWGTVELAEEGYTPYEILQYYYGDDINIMDNVPVEGIEESYPGYPLRFGMRSNEIRIIQNQLNRIRQNYPAIPVINDPEGYFGNETEAAVKEFQKIFDLAQDGIVGRDTWYKIKSIYAGITKLGELGSEIIEYEVIRPIFDVVLQEGSTGNQVQYVQYLLGVLAYYNDNIPMPSFNGVFDEPTKESVIAFQKYYGLTPDGIIGRNTWNMITQEYRNLVQYLGRQNIGKKAVLFPGTILSEGSRGEYVTLLQTYLEAIAKEYPDWALPVTVDGIFGPQTERAVLALQRQYGIDPTGIVGAVTWDRIARLYNLITTGSEEY